MIHGVFFVSCLIVLMLGVFKADGPKWVGVAVLEFWCLYFCPVGILSGFYFRHCGVEGSKNTHKTHIKHT